MDCSIDVLLDGNAILPNSLQHKLRHKHAFALSLLNQHNQTIQLDFFKADEVFRIQNEDSADLSKTRQWCHFQTHEATPSALSVCGVISGTVATHDNYFILHNVENDFYLSPQTTQACVFNQRSKRESPPKPRVPGYYKNYLDGQWRFVELALVADVSMYEKYNKDEHAVTERLESIANIMNSLYLPLNVRVYLVYVEVWKEDKIKVTSSGDATLNAFLDYRKTFIRDHHNDNAHLLTNVRFEAGVVGKAFKGTMCSFDYSGGVDVDHSENAAKVAATLAHEMGHNFGMEHDVEYGTTCECPGNTCIMAPSAGSPPPTFWSDCSLNYISNGFIRGIDLCLENQPDKTVGTIKCGNGIVETGEDCDCGSDVCANNCCDGKTCKLTKDSECASGTCCNLITCKPKMRATECRPSVNICDLPEFCNGETPDCPADFFVQNGHLCPGKMNELCYEGICGSRQDQCQKIWGETGSEAIPACYQGNVKGDLYGNCGYSVADNTYSKCAQENTMCGRLHCETKAERPTFGDLSIVTHAYSYVRAGTDTRECYVIKTNYVTGVGKKKKRQPDPGMVLDGSTCGTDKICVDAKCRFLSDITKTTSKCDDNCYNRGICNNVGNCHCDNGFGGVACEIPGYGGSVNSNTANTHRGVTPSTLLLFLIITSLVFFFGAAIYYRIWKKRNLFVEIWKYLKTECNLHGTFVPVRKAPPPPGGRRIVRIENVNAVWGDSPVTYSTRPVSFAPPAAPLIKSPASPDPLLANQNSYASTAPTVSNKPTVNLSRVPSLRPKEPPPTIPSVPQRPAAEKIDRLHKEHAAELGVKRSVVKPLPPIPQEVSSEKDIRPQEPPPPPPKETKPNLMKPVIPKKPPVKVCDVDVDMTKLDVKSRAAMFDEKRKAQK